MAVLANLVVNFGGSESSDTSHAVMELDDELNRNANGDVLTSFGPNDTVYFLLQYNTAKLELLSLESTAGQIASHGSVSYSRDHSQLWIDDEEIQALPYIPSSDLTHLFYGNEVLVRRVGLLDTQSSGYTYPAHVKLTFSTEFLSYFLVVPDIVMVHADSEEEGYKEFPITIVATLGEL